MSLVEEQQLQEQLENLATLWKNRKHVITSCIKRKIINFLADHEFWPIYQVYSYNKHY